jgi:hypothetical protein
VVREVADRFARAFGRPAQFAGSEGPGGILGDPTRCVSLLGVPEVDLDRLLEWTAAWVGRGGRSLGKPTHFEASDGRF